MNTKVIHIKDAVSGWQNHSDYVYIGRAGKGLSGYFGNPHKVGRCTVCNVDHSQGEAAEKFWTEAEQRFRRDGIFKQAVLKLRGKSLVCFCKPKPCHGDIYVQILKNYIE